MIWLWIAAALISGALAVLIVQRSVRAVTAPRTDNPALAAYRCPVAVLFAYFALGARNLPAQPFKARLAAWRHADPQMLAAPQMAAILRAIAAERPTDPEPLRQLALAEFASREPTEAIQALHRAIALAPG